jgi:hypothetical protein
MSTINVVLCSFVLFDFGPLICGVVVCLCSCHFLAHVVMMLLLTCASCDINSSSKIIVKFQHQTQVLSRSGVGTQVTTEIIQRTKERNETGLPRIQISRYWISLRDLRL